MEKPVEFPLAFSGVKIVVLSGSMIARGTGRVVGIDQGIEGDLLLLGGLEELEQGAELGGVHAVEPVEIVGTDPGEQTFHHGQMTDADGGGGPDGPG